MAKVKGIIVACLLILMSLVFVACGEVQIQTLSFEKENIVISVGDRVDLGLTYSPKEASFDEIEFSSTDSSVAYVLPGTTTLAGLKAGSVVVYAKTKSGQMASINVEVSSAKIQLGVPNNIKIDRAENKLSWIETPGAFNYEIEIQFKNNLITKTTAENYLDLSEIDGLTFTPGEIVSFRVKATAPTASLTYINSDWSDWVKYNELNAVQNLRYDISTNLISFAYNPAEQQIDGNEICFYLKINGLEKKKFFKNDSGTYVYDGFVAEKDGEYLIEVIASMADMENSAPKQIKIVKLQAPTFSKNGQSVSVNTDIDNGKISLEKVFNGSSDNQSVEGKTLVLENVGIDAGQSAKLLAMVEKINDEENIAGVQTYYLASDISEVVVNKLATPTEFKVEEIENENSKVLVKWINESGLTYSLYQNNILMDLEQTKVVESGKEYVVVEIDNLKDAGEYIFYVVADKESVDNEYFLQSDKSEIIKVYKFESISAKFDQSTKTISYEAPESTIGANIILKIISKNESDTRGLTIPILSVSGEEDITDYLNGIEDCELEFIVCKQDEEEVVYLDSNALTLTLTKLLPLSCTFETKNNDTEIEVSIESQENATKYSIYLNGNILLAEISENSIYRTEIVEKTVDDSKFLTFTIKNINFAGNYNLSIVAEGENEEGSLVYILNSEATEYNFTKFTAPTISYTKTNDRVNFTWDAIDGAKYAVYITHKETNERNVRPVYTPTFTWQFKQEGEYLVQFVAEASSSTGNYLKSNINTDGCFATIKKLNTIQNIEHSLASDIMNDKAISIIQFNSVDGAEGYNLVVKYANSEIKSFNTYQIEGDKVKFNLGDVSLYDSEGQYTFVVVATSNQANVLNSKEASITIKKLQKPANVSVNYEEISTTLSFEVLDNHNNFKISIDGGEFENITSNTVDISHLLPGTHQVEIVAVGNGKDVLSSDVLKVSFNVLVRLDAPQNVNIKVDETDDTKTILIFNKVENASYYEIVCEDDSGEIKFVKELRPSEILDAYSVSIARSEFDYGIQKIYVVAKPAEDSTTHEQSVNSKEIYIRKSEDLKSVSNSNGPMDLTGKQAEVDGNLYTNVTIECDWLLSGETKTIKVRNVGTIIDDVDGEGIFNLAGAWGEVVLQRLSSPTVEIVDGILSFDYVPEGVDYNLIIQIDYIGRNSENNEVSNSFEFNLTELGTANPFDIKQFINNNIKLTDKVGDYKIYIKANPTDEVKDLKLNFASVNSAVLEYRYTENLSNTNAVFAQNNNGEISLTIKDEYLKKLSRVFLQITQNGNACQNDIDLQNYTLIKLENTLNNVNLSLSRIKVEGGIKFSINIQQLVNAGTFVVSYNLIGDDKYYLNSSVSTDNNLSKLATPTFKYEFDEFGNKIVLTDSALTSGQNVKFYAKFENEKREFVVDDTSIYFYLPYEWVSGVKVCAESTEVGFINSNEASVNFARASSVSNLHLTEDSVSGQTYLEFDTPNNAFNYYIYVYSAIGELKETLQATTNKVSITDELLAVGKSTFKVAVKGYLEGGQTYLNSELTSLEVKKLANNIELSNPSGVLTWNELVNESEVKEYRIKIGSTLYNFKPEVHTFDLQGLSGYMTIYFKVVGDPTAKIVSSNYKEFLVYKYSAPNSFKVKDGQFNISEDLSGVKLTGKMSYVVYFGNNSFLYADYLQYDKSILEQFYQLIGAGNSGEASAKIVVSTGAKVSYSAGEYLAVNSDETTEIDFGVYEVDVENDEFYLTQKKITDGRIDTYFNWKWVDADFASKGTVRIIIKPQFINTILEIEEGWKIILNEDNEVAAYYLDLAPNNISSDEGYSHSTICAKLPSDLPAGRYMLQVQKTAIKEDTNLSSKNVDVLKFTRLKTPTVSVQEGKLTWAKEQLANYYLMRYKDASNVLGWSGNITENTFEPNHIYASLDSQKAFTYAFLAVGNVPEENPTENLGALEFEYVVSSQSYKGEFTKLRAPGSLILVNGVLRWQDETAYTYYLEQAKQSLIELVFVNLEGEELTSVNVPAESMLSNNTFAFIDDYLAQRDKLKSSGQVVVKYRQLGQTFNNFVNSEYVYLNISEAQTTTINGIDVSYYEFLNAAENVSISEKEGLSFGGITFDPNRLGLNEAIYDIYFKIGFGASAEIKLVKSQSSTNISFEELKYLLKNYDSQAQISEIFVVARGNNTYYFSSLKSTIMQVNTINGEASIYIENGIIKWKEVVGAGSYVLKSELGDNSTEYIIETDGTKFYVNNEETRSVSVVYENGAMVWRFDIAEFNGIANGEHNLNLRYLPVNEPGVFSFPGEWSKNEIRVYKIGTPDVRMENGIFVWGAVAEAQGYKIVVEYDGEVVNELEPTNSLEYLLEVTPGKDVGKYKVSFQSVGSNGSVNGVYYISSSLVVKENLEMQTNKIENVKIDIDGDLIKWESDGENFVLHITGQDGENKINKVVTLVGNKVEGDGLVENSYDLSLLKLYGDNNATYQITIQVAGDSEKLAGEVSGATEFKVLPTMDYIGVEKGYIKFKMQENAEVYIVSLQVASYIYRYQIKKDGDVWKVIGLTQYDILKQETYTPGASAETDIKYDDTYIYFWPSISMTSTAKISVKAKGYEQDDITYISSYDKEYGVQVSRPDMSKVQILNVERNEDAQGAFTTTISWKLSMNFEFTLNYELYRVVDGVEDKINLDGATLNGFTKLVLNGKLDAGEYKLKLQVVPTNHTFYLKSIVKEIGFTVRL